MSREASKSPTRGQKILRRTIVGGAIALATAGLITLVGGESGPLIVHGFTALLLVGSLFEASRMANDSRRALWSLSAAAVAAWMLALGYLRAHSGECDCPALTSRNVLQIIAAAASAGLVASAVSKVLSPRLGLVALLPLCIGCVWMTSSIPGDTLISITVMALFLLSVFGLRPGEFRQGLRDLLSDCARALWFVPALASLALFHAELGQAGLISLIALSKVGDIFGYFGGSLFGKHHPLPRLSPGKTTVGCLGSFIVGTAAGPLLPDTWLPDPRWGVASVLAAAALVNLASQAGDLLESAAKRQAGVKDSGTLFGPSGGFLDLVDSLLLSVPVALLTWPLLFKELV